MAVLIKKVSGGDLMSSVGEFLQSGLEQLEELRVTRIDPVTFEIIAITTAPPIINPAAVLQARQRIAARQQAINSGQ